jgi:CxxC motif-containing protein (DUF1111 family)
VSQRRVLTLGFALASAACNSHAIDTNPRSGGDATVFDTTHDAFSLPAPSLSPQHRASFFVGNSYFNQNWIAAPGSVATRDGLGPLFNARSCSGCHFKDGRGRPPSSGRSAPGLLIRISEGNAGPHGAPRPTAGYGDQIQDAAAPGFEPEARVVIELSPITGQFESGESYTLERPSYRLVDAAYGSLPPSLLLSPRVAPALIGLGLLEAVPVETIEALSDPDDSNGDGISGRPNRVLDAKSGERALGRFGWKAEKPSVLTQSAGAFLGDMGLTTSLFLEENHGTRLAADAPSGGRPEVTDDILAAVVLYARTLGVPARRNVDDPLVTRGAELFESARCSACHVPVLETGKSDDLPELGEQRIQPYTDLLLHDLGDALSDGRPTFEASGSEWRTPPLWGIGLVERVNGHTRFLHDGRARDLSEAILWHGGEARYSRDRFLAMSRDERASLMAFLKSL